MAVDMFGEREEDAVQRDIPDEVGGEAEISISFTRSISYV